MLNTAIFLLVFSTNNTKANKKWLSLCTQFSTNQFTMKVESIKLSQVKVNEANPRTITTDKFNKLVNSILVFPKMLEIRPIVIDKTFKALGGNMRTQALNAIAGMDINTIQARLSSIADYNKLGVDEKAKLNQHWAEWLTNPSVFIIKAETLTESEKQQFIIKDNVAYGAWDFDALANKFDSAKLGDWGMDVWQMPTPTAVPPMGGAVPAVPPTYAVPSETPGSYEDDGSGVVNQFEGQLPPELTGQDLTPADLPDIQGTDEVAMERIIIVYPKDRVAELANLIGLQSIDKVVYRLNEILGE